jgi:hypothetical protein
MKKILITTIFTFFVSLSVSASWAGISKTKSFKVSVTLPAHVMIPKEDSPSESAKIISERSFNRDISYTEIVRNNKSIILKTIVVR